MYPILNDILSITIQENFNDDVTAAWSLGSSNFCRAHQQNGLSCSMEAGPQQGLGTVINSYWQISGALATPIYEKLIQPKLMDSYSILFKFLV